MRQLKDAVRDVLLDVKRAEMQAHRARQREAEIQAVVERLVPLAVARALSAHFEVWVPASALRVSDFRLSDTSSGPTASVSVTYAEPEWDAAGYTADLYPSVMVDTTTWAVLLPNDLASAWRPLRRWEPLAYPLGFVEAIAHIVLDGRRTEPPLADTVHANGHVVSSC